MTIVSLRDVCSRVDYGLTTSATESGGPKFLRITDIEAAHVDWARVPHCLASESDAARYALASGDVVVARTGASTGRSQWVDVEEPAVFASYLVRFRAGESIKSRYLGYVLSSQQWYDHVWSVAHGKSAQPNMSASAMADFRFELPALVQQAGIVEVLGAIDDKIVANDKVITAADGLAAALTTRAFDGAAITLNELAFVTMGSSPPGTSYNETRDGVPFYQGVRDFGVRFPVPRVSTTAPVRMAESTDTLVSVRAPVGRTNLASCTLCLGRGLAGLRSRTGRAMTLFHQIRAAHAAWAPYEAEGTVFGAINKKQLESIAIPSITASEGHAVEQSLSALEERIRSALKENDHLSDTRDELLPLLMSGRLTVMEAKNIAEDAL